MEDEWFQSRRRRFIAASLTGTLTALAGCSQAINKTGSRETTTQQHTNLNSADFSFTYHADRKRVTINYGSGGHIQGGDLEVRASTGTRVTWAELGSTTADTDTEIQPGANAVLGKTIINWKEPITRNETIRLVYTGQQTPATLGRFTPPGNSKLTSTVPSTTTTTSRVISTATTTAQNEKPPDIRVFSITNPSQSNIRVSLKSNERLKAIAVQIRGPTNTTLTKSDFTTQATAHDNYTYETTYPISGTRNISATLSDATNMAGINGAAGTTKKVSIKPKPVIGSQVNTYTDSTGILNLGYSSDGDKLYYLRNSNGTELVALDADTMKATSTEHISDKKPKSLAVSQDFLAIGLPYKVIIYSRRDIQKQKVLGPYHAHPSELSFSPSESYLVIGTGGHMGVNTIVYSTGSWSKLGQTSFSNDYNAVTNLAFSPSGKYYAYGMLNSRVVVVGINGLKKEFIKSYSSKYNAQSVRNVLFFNDNLVLNHGTDRVTVYSDGDWFKKNTIKYTSHVSSISKPPSENVLSIGTTDGTTRYYSTNLSQIDRKKFAKTKIKSVVWSANNQYILDGNNMIHVISRSSTS